MAAALISIPTNCAQGPLCTHPWLHLVSVSGTIAVPTAVRWELIAVLSYVSLMMISDVEQLFLCLLATCMPSLESIYSHILPSFYSVFVWIWRSILCVLDISLFSHILYADIFFSLGRLPFKCLMISFAMCKFQFDVIPLVYFCFCCLCFWCLI